MHKANPHQMPLLDTSKGMGFGLYTLGEHVPNPHTGKRRPASQRIKEIIEMTQLAEQAAWIFSS